MNGKTIYYPFRHCRKCGSIMRYDENGKLVCIDCIRFETAVNNKREQRIGVK